MTTLTFAFSDVHWSLPELELWGTGHGLFPGSCMLRPQCPKLRMIQMAFFFSTFFFLLNNWNDMLIATGVASPLIWPYWHWIYPGRWKDWRLWFVGLSLSRVLQQPQDCPRPASRLGILAKTTSSDVANESWHLGPMFQAFLNSNSSSADDEKVQSITHSPGGEGLQRQNQETRT